MSRNTLAGVDKIRIIGTLGVARNGGSGLPEYVGKVFERDSIGRFRRPTGGTFFDENIIKYYEFIPLEVNEDYVKTFLKSGRVIKCSVPNTGLSLKMLVIERDGEFYGMGLGVNSNLYGKNLDDVIIHQVYDVPKCAFKYLDEHLTDKNLVYDSAINQKHVKINELYEAIDELNKTKASIEADIEKLKKS